MKKDTDKLLYVEKRRWFALFQGKSCEENELKEKKFQLWQLGFMRKRVPKIGSS
jgi:hypothetical protein